MNSIRFRELGSFAQNIASHSGVILAASFILVNAWVPALIQNPLISIFIGGDMDVSSNSLQRFSSSSQALSRTYPLGSNTIALVLVAV